MEHLEDGKFKVIYYSLEMNSEMLFAKLLSLYIFEHYHIELSTKELLSRKKDYILSDENYKIVKECLPWLKQIENIITVYDKGLNSKTLYSSLMKELEMQGEFKEEGKRKIYIPKDEELITLVVIDHLSLVQTIDGHSLKQEMDLISSYLVTLRNRCKITPLVIMQANRESSSMDRRKEGMNNLTINDMKDTGAPNKNLIEKYIHPDCLYKLDAPKTPLNREITNSDLDNPVLNLQEIEENAERLEVMPNE